MQSPAIRRRNHRRRSTSARGYGRVHQAARAALERTLPAPCAYGCGRILQRVDAWVAAHWDDRDPTSPRVVSCPTCNQRAKDGQIRPVIPVTR
jgi:hypothetical protein